MGVPKISNQQPSPESQRIIATILPAMVVDVRGSPFDTAHAGLDIAGLRQWWDKAYKQRFRGDTSAVVRGKGRGQFDTFVVKCGSVATARTALGFLLDNWPEIRKTWKLTSNPTPGIIVGFRGKLLESMRRGEILPLFGDEATKTTEEVEFEEWS